MSESDSSEDFAGSPLVPGAADAADHAAQTRFLVSTLLVYVAKGDGAISGDESNLMIDLIASRCGVRSAEALEQLSSSVMALADDREIAQKLQATARKLATAERQDIFDLVVETALADERLETGETRAIKFAGQILGLSQNTIYSALRKFPGA